MSATTTFSYASDIPHWDGEFPKNLKYLWNHPDLSQKTKEKILTFAQLSKPAKGTSWEKRLWAVALLPSLANSIVRRIAWR
jgi:hypothetical protein